MIDTIVTLSAFQQTSLNLTYVLIKLNKQIIYNNWY